MRSEHRRIAALTFIAVLVAVALPARAAWQPAGVDLTRPRLIVRAAAVPGVQARLDREPYRALLRELWLRIRQADAVALDDHTIGAERIKARAARNLAFALLVDRMLVDDQAVPFPAAERRAAADRVRAWLATMYSRSRLAVPPPLGGWDRDISTSEELLNYASAYDTLLGAGVDLGADEAAIVANLTALAGELYENYVDPASASGYATLHQNNHRSKTGAALATAAIALADYTPPAGSDPRGVREPARWLAYGLEQIDLVMRYALVSGDGAYGEGPFYLRYASQSLLPFWRAWDSLLGDLPLPPPSLTTPNWWRHPLFARQVRWALDMTVPDGSLAPTDDGNPGRAYYFGAAPLTPATAWRWANAPDRFDTDGNISLAADALVHYDDTIVPAPPDGSPNAFYFEGGQAAFRSGWDAGAVLAIVQGEHGVAAEFGRAPDGRGVAPQSHEHAEPGAFLLHAYGERLALDPGYFNFTDRGLVGKPQDHNLILIDGAGPGDYLAASLAWLADPFGPPPADGQATLTGALDADGLAAVRVVSRYGVDPARVERRFLFADDRYLLIADRVTSVDGAARRATWLVHGNGGGDSGGTFAVQPNGAQWGRPGATLTAAIAVAADGAPLELSTRDGLHENADRSRRTHSVLEASATGRDLYGLTLLVPSPAGAALPQTTRIDVTGFTVLRLDDGAHTVVAWQRAAPGPPWGGTPGAAGSDGSLALLDSGASDGRRIAWAEEATRLALPGGVQLRAGSSGRLGLHLTDTLSEVIADVADPAVRLAGVAAAGAADGACAVLRDGEGLRLVLGGERRVRLRAVAGNSAPAADPRAERDGVIVPPQVVTLDGIASCDADGDALTPRWELVSAPGGSVWSLDGADSWQPVLFVDRPGPYRVRLVVTDAHGAASRPAELLVVGGEACLDTIDNDLDGLFDGADPDCDEGGNHAPRRRATIAALRAEVGSVAVADLGAWWDDADGDALTRLAASIDPRVATAAVQGEQLVVRGRGVGQTRVLVAADDGRGGRARDVIAIEVVARTTCVADCDNDGAVTIDELLTGVTVSLGAPAERCLAADPAGDGAVSIADLVRAVGDALRGCVAPDSEPTPDNTVAAVAARDASDW